MRRALGGKAGRGLVGSSLESGHTLSDFSDVCMEKSFDEIPYLVVFCWPGRSTVRRLFAEAFATQ